MPNRDPEADMTRFSEIADELGLEDDEKENFVGSAMKRIGYTAKTITEWLFDAPENEKGDGDFFSARRQERQSRPVTSGTSRKQTSPDNSKRFGYGS